MRGKEKPRLLLFDDNEALLTSLTAYLENEYDIVAAATPEEAKRKFKEFTEARKEFQVAVIDMWNEREFPVDKEAGLTIIRYIQAYDNPPECIVFTAHEEMGNIVACMEAGAFSYALKGDKSTPLLLKQTIIKAYQCYRDREIKDKLILLNSIYEKMGFKNPFFIGHSERVKEWSIQIGMKLNLDKNVLNFLRLAAILHDIIIQEDSDNEKTGCQFYKIENNSNEYSMIETQVLFHILGENPSEVLEGIKYQSENWDGSGAPDGKKKEEIPLISRIIRVACEFDQCFSPPDRRFFRNTDEALSHLKAIQNTKLEEKLVGIFVTLFEEGKITPVLPWVDTIFKEIEGLLNNHNYGEVLQKSEKLLQEFAGKPGYEQAALNVALGDLFVTDSRTRHIAEKFYDRATEHHPNFAEAYYKRGLALLQQGRWPEAERDFYVAGAILPTYIEAHQKRGETLLKGGLWEEALRALDRVISLDDKNGAAYLLKAKCYESKAAEEEEPEKEKEFLRKAQNHRQKAEEIQKAAGV